MTPCKFGESRHYGPCCFIHAEERPLLECIAALEASNRELRAENGALAAQLESCEDCLAAQTGQAPSYSKELKAALARREG